MTPLNLAGADLSEQHAAHALGVSLPRLRDLIQRKRGLRAYQSTTGRVRVRRVDLEAYRRSHGR